MFGLGSFLRLVAFPTRDARGKFAVGFSTSSVCVCAYLWLKGRCAAGVPDLRSSPVVGCSGSICG